MLWQSIISTCEPGFVRNSTISPEKASESISSLIQKFEALSLCSDNNLVQQPSLRTPRKVFPQQVLRNASPIQASLEKKGAIFSPTRRGKGRFGDMVPNSELGSGKGDVFSSPPQRYGRGMNQHESISLYGSYAQHDEYMIQERDSLSNVRRNSELESSQFASRARDRMPSSSRGREIKDKIQFFEESGKNSSGSLPSPMKSTSSYSNKLAVAFRACVPYIPLNITPPCLYSAQTNPNRESIKKRNADHIHPAATPDITLTRKLWVQNEVNDITTEMEAQATRVAVLHGVLTKYQYQIPRDGLYQDPSNITVNNTPNAQYSEKSLSNKRDNWQYIPRVQDNIHPLGMNLANPNMGLTETTGQVYGTESSRAKQQVPQHQPSAVRAVKIHRLTNKNEETRFLALLPDEANNICMPSDSHAVFNPQVTNARQLPLPTNGANCYLTNQMHERPLLISTAVGDRLLVFERGLKHKSNRSRQIKDSQFKTMGGLITEPKKSFEEGCRGSYSPGRFEGRSSTKDINSIMEEFREIEIADTLRKQDGIVGRRQTLMGHNPIPSRRPRDMKDGKMDGTWGDLKEMIVREAACGLEEPKPLRLTEIRSIIWLCRGQPCTHQLRRRAMSEPPTG